jgi:hypothetical protein
MAPECRICGVNLAQQDHPLARLVAWPPALLPGDLPTREEMCRRCQALTAAALTENARLAAQSMYAHLPDVPLDLEAWGLAKVEAFQNPTTVVSVEVEDDDPPIYPQYRISQGSWDLPPSTRQIY